MIRQYRRVAITCVSLIGAVSVHGEAEAQQGTAVQLQEIVVAPTPVPGSIGINVDKVPAAVSTVPARDFTERKSPSVADAITSHVPAAIATNVDGSDLSPDLFFRGFNISRITGVANGLAVYQNGVRINEAFGDSVNLDVIPPIAVDRTDVYTNNPIFGLNALGGAIAFTMKNGFTFHGGDATILGGSFGRVNGFLEYGKQVGNYSFYVAADGYRDGGYRPFGAQNAQRTYADLGYRSQDSEVHAIAQYGRTFLGVQGVTPLPLIQRQYNSVFSTPQTTENSVGLAQLTGRFDISQHWTINSNVYFRKFDQYHVDGNDADVEECEGPGLDGTLCVDEDAAAPGTPTRRLQFAAGGRPVPFDPNVAAYGTTARTAIHTSTFGTQQQITNRDTFFGHANYFVAGASLDTSNTGYSSTTTLGQLNPQFENLESGFPGAGTILNTRGNIGIAPIFVDSRATYVGVFALDTFNITKRLALTAGARFNNAFIKLQDRSGFNPDLNSASNYSRINPVVGATYEFAPAFSVYGGYSEANRAPTPLENACSDPNRPCILETSLVADPPLKQVVSHTIEAGARGIYAIPARYLGGNLTYKAGYFRTQNTDDIVSQAAPITGAGFFANVPGTLRQGVEAGLIYGKGDWSFYGNYAYVDATFLFTSVLSSPNNPFATGGNIIVRPGDRIPSIPRHLGKLGFEYRVTPRFTIGSDTILVGSQYYLGDESNQNAQLPFYYRVDARASYQVTDQMQVFVLSTNLTGNRYGTFGTFYDPATSGTGVSPTLRANDPANGGVGVAQSLTVAQPRAVYGGIKVTF